MSDNIGYTPGTGATIAADDISGILHQRVKLSLGADGTAVDAPGDATHGMDVDVTRLPTVTNFKCVTASTAQTGAAVWTPAAGMSVVITALQIQSFGTTAGVVQLWFGASGDTTYTRSTDAPLFDGEFSPSGTNKPGVYVTYPTAPRGTADYLLRLTTNNTQSITVTVWGYEI
jgi:hypothetical protein